MLVSQDPQILILLQSHKHRDEQNNHPLELCWKNGASWITKIDEKSSRSEITSFMLRRMGDIFGLYSHQGFHRFQFQIQLMLSLRF